MHMAISRKAITTPLLALLFGGCTFMAGRLSVAPWHYTAVQSAMPPRPTFTLQIGDGKITGTADAAITVSHDATVIPAQAPIDLPISAATTLNLYTDQFLGKVVVNPLATTTTTCTLPTAAAPSTAIIASSKGTKYYFADCSEAKKIKTENVVHFSSEAEAKQAGYQPSQCVTTRAAPPS